MMQAALSAGLSRIWYKRASDIAAPAHLEALIATKLRIQAMIQDAVWAGFLPEHPWKLALPRSSKQPTSRIKAPLMTKIKPRRSCKFRRRLRQAANNWRIAGTKCRKPDHPSSASQDEDSDDMDFSAPRKSRLGAPQLQAQLSRLTDRTRLRRLKKTLLSKWAWQQVTRIEDPCHTQVPLKWLYHLDACSGSVLTPHDYIANVQKRLANRLGVGGGQCRCCGSFLDPQSEHAETCSTAQAARGHCACVHAVVCGMKLADPGITTEPRGLTASKSRPADIFTTAGVPGRSAALDVCVASSIAAAAQAAFDRKLSYYINKWNCGTATTRLSLPPS